MTGPAELQNPGFFVTRDPFQAFFLMFRLAA
jgi:hypothetical protein